MDKAEKTVATKSDVWLDEEGILRVKFPAGVDIDVDEVKRCFAVYERLGCREKKVLQLLDATAPDFTFSKEARDFAAKNGRDFFIASAIVSPHLHVRIIVNFFNSFYKHDVPFKLFGTEEDALKWLRKFKQ